MAAARAGLTAGNSVDLTVERWAACWAAQKGDWTVAPKADKKVVHSADWTVAQWVVLKVARRALNSAATTAERWAACWAALSADKLEPSMVPISAAQRVGLTAV